MKTPYGHNIHIIGIAGTEGAALLEYLHEHYPSAQITAHNSGNKAQFLKFFRLSHIAMEKTDALETGKRILELEKVQYRFDQEYLNGIENADTIFVPQSWYLYAENKPLQAYRRKFCSITRLYFDLFPGKIIGITGSNGKTTSANLIANIMKRAFPSSSILYSGNDRRASQVLSQISGAVKDDWLVLEISNRQLMIDLGSSPDISVITNITPNHLNEYKDFEEYANVKASLLQHRTDNQWSVLNQDDPESHRLIEIDEGEMMPFSTQEQLTRGVFVHFDKIVIKHADKEDIIMPVNEFPLKGKHNLSNALAAVAATYLAGATPEIIALSLRSTKTIPQRMELVDSLNNVEYYNDTASTVPESTIAAIKALKKPKNNLVLIMGGKSKGSDYGNLIMEINTSIAQVYLIESPLADEIENGIRIPLHRCKTLRTAVQLSEINTKPGDIVLFSPASEYFMYFRNKMPGYKNFRHMVNTLKTAS